MSSLTKVFIPTSGVGVPLGNITQYTNRVLIKVGKKPTLSYIVDAYPPGTEFIIAIGHFGSQVKEFVQLVYPQLNIKFVEIDPYQGPGSCLAYTMLQAMPLLQCPFIYHASDTILPQKLEHLGVNWVAGYRSEGSSHYASFDVVDGHVRHMYDKGTLNPDFLHVGVVGIEDFEKFWDHLKKLYEVFRNNESLGDVHAIRKMIDEGVLFRVRPVDKWYDVGNVDSLNKVRVEIPDSFHILDKVEESIFLYDDFVVKFFHDEASVQKRVERANVLRGLVPPIEQSTKNFYRYSYVEGELYSDAATPKDFKNFLQWATDHLWKPVREVDPAEFQKICFDFYYDKSIKRIEKFCQSRSVVDQEIVINDERVPSVSDLFKKIDFAWLSDTEQVMFHGDFILDNMLKTKNGYCLLDWRQDFGGLIKAGDMYYDLAKLNHNLTVNHGIINDNLFTITVRDDHVECDILRKERLVQCQQVFFDFLRERGLDQQKVRMLTALIWLNMSPLHHHPFDLFLFYFGKLNLWNAIQHHEHSAQPQAQRLPA